MGRRLGQHFLASRPILERIAASVCATSPETIVEIGAGRGALTEFLLQSGAHVHAIELDPEMVAQLAHRFPAHPGLTVHHADVLSTDLAQWGPASLAGNLPYFITSPILDRIRRARTTIRTSTLLIQKEVADRVIAKPKSRDYGFLTVVTQSWADTEHIVHVPPEAFRPPPKVDSSVVLLTGKPDIPTDLDAFLKFASHAFRQKRKNLRNNLSGIYPMADWEHMAERTLRAEQLSIEELRALWRKLS
ncbi:MAG: 16S rRNA (adenine(1518)-N(6)/adenine(1519)-N(6))-dimethyltransferase RsmA [Bryobacteraceae bacterium]